MHVDRHKFHFSTIICIKINKFVTLYIYIYIYIWPTVHLLKFKRFSLPKLIVLILVELIDWIDWLCWLNFFWKNWVCSNSFEKKIQYAEQTSVFSLLSSINKLGEIKEEFLGITRVNAWITSDALFQHGDKVFCVFKVLKNVKYLHSTFDWS